MKNLFNINIYRNNVKLLAPISWQPHLIPVIRYGTNLWIDPLSGIVPETPWATLILSVSLKNKWIKIRYNSIPIFNWNKFRKFQKIFYAVLILKLLIYWTCMILIIIIFLYFLGQKSYEFWFVVLHTAWYFKIFSAKLWFKILSTEKSYLSNFAVCKDQRRHLIIIIYNNSFHLKNKYWF